MITYIKGDLFAASGILAHACNVRGHWGAGVALAFKKRYPAAFKLYRDHCHNHTPEQLVGTCFLAKEGSDTIACLFTNHNDTVDGIVANTRQCVEDMLKQVNEPVSMPLINAGIFGVPWDKTEAVLEEFEAKFIVYKL